MWFGHRPRSHLYRCLAKHAVKMNGTTATRKNEKKRFAHEPNSLQTRKKSNKWQAHDVRAQFLGLTKHTDQNYKTNTTPFAAEHSIKLCVCELKIVFWLLNGKMCTTDWLREPGRSEANEQRKKLFHRIFNGHIYLGFRISIWATSHF